MIVKNVPYYKAKKVLETEVMKLDPPPRPRNWGVSQSLLIFVFPYAYVWDPGTYDENENLKEKYEGKSDSLCFL